MRLRINSQNGFTLVEMMVALVLGLIVVAAVISLVTSIMKSNRQTIESTRLMQELRATAAVVSTDVRRSRSVVDPLAAVTQSGGNPFKNVTTATAGCIQYGYEGGAGGNYRTMHLTSEKIYLSTRNSSDPGCNGTDLTSTNPRNTILTSNGVRITALTFEPLPLDASNNPPSTDVVREIRMTITGSLITEDPEMKPISRTITQSIFIPSIGTGS